MQWIFVATTYKLHTVKLAIRRCLEQSFDMKRFAIYLPSKEQPEIIEGISATVKRQKDGLKVTVKRGGEFNGTTIFKGAIVFTEVCDEIKVY